MVDAELLRNGRLANLGFREKAPQLAGNDIGV